MYDTVAVPREAGANATSDDAALVRAAREDPTAFGQLYDRYADRVYAYLRARTESEEDAADLMQHVFVQALDALPRYRGQGAAFAAWLFRIARNAATDFYRRRRRAVTWDLVPEAMQPIAEQDLEANILRREALGRLRELVAALDADTRELLVLRFTAGLTVADIAAVVGKSESATQKKLFRIIQSLKERYHDR